VHEAADERPFRARVGSDLHERKREDFLASFEALRRYELATDPAALAATTRLLARPPTDYRAYVTGLARRDDLRGRTSPAARSVGPASAAAR
jgi:hypothetical protein